MSYVISIPSYETKDGYTLYNLRVKTVTEGVWSFQQRYSVLRDGHEQMRRSIRAQLPPFPPKKLWGNTKDSFVRIRRAALEEYLNSISDIPEVCSNPLFRSLIRPKTIILEEAPAPITTANKDRAAAKPAVQLTRELESRLTSISHETASQFINLSDLPAPLDAEDMRRKQREYGRMVVTAKVEWKWSSGVRSEGEGKGIGREMRRWAEEKTKELESACGGLQGAVVLAD
jgi:hypothetical protein